MNEALLCGGGRDDGGGCCLLYAQRYMYIYILYFVSVLEFIKNALVYVPCCLLNVVPP